MTDREFLCLQYLDHLMEAPAISIGRYIFANQAKPDGSNLSAIGAAVCGRLRKRGLVTWLPDLRAWRITAAGREALHAFA
jgi:hypothetical protein